MNCPSLKESINDLPHHLKWGKEVFFIFYFLWSKALERLIFNE